MQINPLIATPVIATPEINPSSQHFIEKPESVPAKTKKEILPEPQPKQAEKQTKLQNVLAEHNISLVFRRDDETKAVIVELVDSKTGEAIRQIPSEVSLKLTASFTKLQGQWVDEKC